MHTMALIAIALIAYIKPFSSPRFRDVDVSGWEVETA
jgi:hypothetical protein